MKIYYFFYVNINERRILNEMKERKLKKKKLRKKYHYDYNSFFIDDVLRELKTDYKKRHGKFKRVGLTV